MRQLVAACVGFLSSAVLIPASAPEATAQEYEPTWESLDSRPMPEWFGDAKFGIFIHWGVYSVPAWIRVQEGKYASYAEWYYARVMGELKGEEDFHQRSYGPDFEYRDFAPLFTAELFDPDFWAELFAESGARYVVLTSKHHDGFCLWPTESPFKEGWNSMDVGPKRDLVGDLTEAVRARGLRMGLYYSLIEWETTRTGRPQWALHSPGGHGPLRDPHRSIRGRSRPSPLRELVTRYQPAVIFADGGEWDHDEEFWKTRDFLAWLYNTAANRDEVVVNDRWAKGMPGKHGDYFSSEYQDAEGIGAWHPWEESRGMGRSYGYNRAENINHYRSSKELVHELIDVVSRGGNLLLNVGPTADGRIPVIMQERLRDIGSWLQINGEAIYGTRPWAGNGLPTTGNPPNVRYTRKGDDLYAHLLEWPDGELALPVPEPRPGTRIRLLGLERDLPWRYGEDTLYVDFSGITFREMPGEWAWTVRLEGFTKTL